MTRGYLLALLLFASPVLAEFEPVYHPTLDIKSTANEITIDGVLSDGEWDDGAVADNFAEHSPGDQVQPPVDTRVLVTFDADNLYVAYICYDDPLTVRASFCKRDRIFQDDNVIIALDTYGDGATGFEIAANPYGIQGDLFYSANGGEDSSYDLIYYTAGQINEEGWVVEFAIPFSSLRFPDREEHEWRVDFWRNRSRDVRYQMSWAAYDRDESCWPCQWGTMRGLKDLSPPTGIELLPAIVGSQAGSRNDDGAFENGKVVTRGSFTAKYSVSSNVTLEGTVRPDFSQVESDAAQIDVNSRFALFYPEKRPFFMEGSDLFNTWFNAVYTRSINDPTVAGKVTGRSGKTSFAVLSALDRNTPIILPFEEHSHFLENGESFSNIFRVKQELGEQTSIGVVGTDRRYSEGGSGSLVGIDSRIRLDRNYGIEVQYLRSFTEEPDDTLLTKDFNDHVFDGGRYTEAFDGEKFKGQALYASLERDGRSWSFDLDYWDRNPTFRAENGFETYNNQRYGSVYTGYLFRFENSPLVEWVQPSISANRTWNYDGQQKSDMVQLTLQGRLRWAQTNSHIYYNQSSEVVSATEFDDLWRAHFCANFTPTKKISMGGNFNVGDQVYYKELEVGHQIDYGAWLDLRPWDRLLLETNFSHSHSQSKLTDTTYFDGYVTRSRISLQITRELSVRLILQYNNFRELWEADPLVTYQLNPFSIFYVGSTRDYRIFTPNNREDSTWQLASRQYFLKFQYLFRI
jgi:Domain of unknown function (DUF5916)/Carbohydrate family 9 binding domain-like